MDNQISHTYADNNKLHAAVLMFIDGTGLFIPTNKIFAIGAEVAVQLAVKADETQEFSGQGIVAWVTPMGAEGHHPAGVAISLNHASLKELRSFVLENIKNVEINKLGTLAF